MNRSQKSLTAVIVIAVIGIIFSMVIFNVPKDTNAENSNETFITDQRLNDGIFYLEPVHIKIASKIIAKVRFPKYRTSSLS